MKCNIDIDMKVATVRNNQEQNVFTKDMFGKLSDFCAFPWRLLVPLLVILAVVVVPCVLMFCLHFMLDKMLIVASTVLSSTLLMVLAVCLISGTIAVCAIVWAYRIWAESQRRFLKIMQERECFFVEKVMECISKDDCNNKDERSQGKSIAYQIFMTTTQPTNKE